jgi:hypothetical protein
MSLFNKKHQLFNIEAIEIRHTPIHFRIPKRREPCSCWRPPFFECGRVTLDRFARERSTDHVCFRCGHALDRKSDCAFTESWLQKALGRGPPASHFVFCPSAPEGLLQAVLCDLLR